MRLRALLKRQLHEPTPDVRTLVADCPQDLADFIRIATEKSPKDRYRDCATAIGHLNMRRVTTPLSTTNRTRVVIDYGDEHRDLVEKLVSSLEQRVKGLEVSCKVTHLR